LNGGAGEDFLLGEAFVGNAGADKLMAGKDSNVAPATDDCGEPEATVAFTCGDTIIGELLIDILGTSTDTLTGSGETLLGGDGDDAIIGDYIVSVGGGDLITLGADSIRSGAGDDTLVGDVSVSSPLASCDFGEGSGCDVSIGLGAANPSLLGFLPKADGTLSASTVDLLGGLISLPGAHAGRSASDIKTGKDTILAGDGSDTAFGDLVVGLGYGLANLAEVGKFNFASDSIDLGNGDDAGAIGTLAATSLNIGNTYKLGGPTLKGGNGNDAVLAGNAFVGAGETSLTLSTVKTTLQGGLGTEALVLADLLVLEGFHACGEDECEEAAAAIAKVPQVSLLNAQVAAISAIVGERLGATAIPDLVEGGGRATVKLSDDLLDCGPATEPLVDEEGVPVVDEETGEPITVPNDCIGTGARVFLGYDGSKFELGKDKFVGGGAAGGYLTLLEMVTGTGNTVLA
jgi:hypothetical protein